MKKLASLSLALALAACSSTRELPPDETVAQKIENRIQRSRPEILGCYAAAPDEIVARGGLLTVGFTIQANGKVAGVQLIESELAHRDTEECMLRVFRHMRFSALPEGGMLEMKYPIRLSSR